MMALALPPLGLYPLAWVALVPILVRWSQRPARLDYARELYALFLTTSCCVGFWILFNPDPGTAALGGTSLFLAPLPLTAAFVLAGRVKDRFGLAPGLAALALNVLAVEYLTLAFGVSVPWLLLGHTQVEALEFIQMADVGGVLLLSLWVLLLNGAAFVAALRGAASGTRYGEQGAAIALFVALLAVPVAYGGIRTAQADVPGGYTRVGIVQPGVPPADWDRQDAHAKVQYLATLSDDLLERWRPSALDTALAAQAAFAPRGAAEVGLVIWPQGSLPYLHDEAADAALYGRLEAWAGRRGVALLTGATARSPATTRRRARPSSSARAARPSATTRCAGSPSPTPARRRGPSGRSWRPTARGSRRPSGSSPSSATTSGGSPPTAPTSSWSCRGTTSGAARPGSTST